MRMTYMYKEKVCTVIDIDFKDENIKITNFTADPAMAAFGKC